MTRPVLIALRFRQFYNMYSRKFHLCRLCSSHWLPCGNRHQRQKLFFARHAIAEYSAASLAHQRQGTRMPHRAAMMFHSIEMVEHASEYGHGKDREHKSSDAYCKLAVLRSCQFD